MIAIMDEFYRILSPMQFLEHFAALSVKRMRAQIAGETQVRAGDPVRYIGNEYPEIFNAKGIVVNSWIVNGLVIVHFPDQGEWHIRPENLVWLI